jgi:KaiC/GvpD/RAD55 family RecA-like ATPase
MNQERGEEAGRFAVPEYLPVDDLDPGTNVVVSGPTATGARHVALALATAGAPEEGLLLVSADVGGESLLAHCESVGGDLDRERVAVVDCSGADDAQRRFAPGVGEIDGPGDVGAIGMEASRLYEELIERGHDGIRVGAVSVSTLLLESDLSTVSQFLHALTGRVVALGDLGVFLVDSAAGDRRATETLERFCDRRVTVRREDDGRPAVRVDDVARPGGLGDWTAFDPPWEIGDDR